MAPLLQGTQVGRYRIVSPLGAGGMGEVYRAHDPSLDRPVALKILPEGVAGRPDALRRFEQEAKAASSLRHPHIVAIHEIGESRIDGANIHFIAMELVEGRTLGEVVAHKSLRDALEILVQVADALAKAHAANIVHRDLKPANIMVTAEGYAKVLDFGLAKLMVDEAPAPGQSATIVRATTDGIVVGTPGYMSPEQARGEKVDHRSDVFSFGCILYEVATRRRPFEGATTIDVLHNVIHADPPAVHVIAPETPAELRRMIRRCLAKDPERRYQSMKDVALQLRDLVQDFETTAASTPASPQRRSHVWKWVAAAGFLIGIATVAVAWRRATPLPAERSSNLAAAKLTQLTRRTGAESFPRISPDGNFIIFVSEADGDEDIYLQRLGGFKEINLTENSEASDTQPAISPDGRFVAFRSQRDGGGLYVMGATGESVRRLTDFCFDPAWSPDGARIACSTLATGTNPLSKGGFSYLWVIDVASGERRQLGNFDGVQPAWSPGGERIAFWSNGGMGSRRDIYTVASSGGTPLRVTDDAHADWSPAWSPDGAHLYFASARGGTMALWRVPIDARSGTVRGAFEPLPSPSRWNGPIDVSRDGRLVFSAADIRSEIYRQPIDTTSKAMSEPVAVFTGITRAVECDVSPDGKWLAFRSEGEREDLFVVRSDGSDLRQLTDDAAHDRGVKWSPDGKRIAFYSDREGGVHDIWSISPDGSDARKEVDAREMSVWFPRWSPDGSKISVNNQTGTFIVDLTRSPRTLSALPPIDADRLFRGFAWSRDGKWIAGRAVHRRGAPSPGLFVFSVETSSYAQLGVETIGMIDWLHDNSGIVFRSTDAIRVVDRVTQRVRTVRNERGSVWSFGGLSVSPDGRDVYFNRTSAEIDVWMLTLPQ